MTMAEFFMIRPHGPNCWMGLGALRERVRLEEAINTYLDEWIIVTVILYYSMLQLPAHVDFIARM